ncbi:MAG: hypothetical protein A3H34_04620 [Betaproteobacteria bacterium RIFCSPLOWO2_02_FULL_67_19]|nr:MAG: hypothetical protein A3H34_04620 [Betaproteobacteria bacterium RIFCSPLOWO2_02_FULL_67_19]
MRRALYLSLRAFSALDHWLSGRLTPAGWLALGAAAAAAAAGIDLNQTLTAQAFAFLGALLVAAFAASLTFRARFEVRRELPRYATAGERFAYRVTLTNRGTAVIGGATLAERFRDPRPSYADWCRAREPGEERRNWFDRNAGYFRWRWLIEKRVPRLEDETALPVLAPGASHSVRLGFTPRRRGRIELAGLRIARTDPLGLVRGLARHDLEAQVVALPKRYRLPALALPGRRKFQPGGVSLAASVGDSEEFLALRDYRPGDPLQRLHWKSFARTGKPIVKEFQDEFYERHALALDTGRAVGEDAAFEDAVSVAASFAFTLDTQECLLDLLFVGGERASDAAVRTYTAGRGQLRAEHMLEVLAAVRPSAPADFTALAHAVLARRANLASVIVVLLAWDEPRRAFVAAARRAGLEVRALLVCDPAAAPSPSDAGLTVLRPGAIESGLATLQ